MWMCAAHVADRLRAGQQSTFSATSDEQAGGRRLATAAEICNFFHELVKRFVTNQAVHYPFYF
jgi:hypothetical protein